MKLTTGPFLVPSFAEPGFPNNILFIILKNDTDKEEIVHVEVHQCPPFLPEARIQDAFVTVAPHQCFVVFQTIVPRNIYRVNFTGNSVHEKAGKMELSVIGGNGNTVNIDQADPTLFFRHEDMVEVLGRK